MDNMKIPLCKIEKDYSILEAIKQIIDSGSFVNGNFLTQFEKAISTLFNVKYAIAVNSGTSALYCSLIALNLKPGDEIIVPSMTFFATISPILALGGKPIFVDINPITYCIDETQIRSKITKKTKAIIPVHIFGCIVNMDVILDIAKEFNLFVIEDACQAHGAEYHGKKAGSFGDIGCFSLYPSKNMSVLGQGGIVTTNNTTIYEQIHALREYGQTSKNQHDYVGFNFGLSEIHAAIGLIQCQKLNQFNHQRIKNAQNYYNQLKDFNKIILPQLKTDGSHVYHIFAIRIPITENTNRDKAQVFLREHGIQTGIHYPIPCHKQKAFIKVQGKGINLPKTEQVCQEILSIPMSPHLTEDEINYVVEKLRLYIS